MGVVIWTRSFSFLRNKVLWDRTLH